MTTVKIIAKTIDEVIPDASLDREISNKVITSCYTCGGIAFYQVVEHNYEDSKYATDRCIYCVRCGHLHSGFTDDPFNELALDTDDITDADSTDNLISTDTIGTHSNDSVKPDIELHCPFCNSTRVRIVYTDDECTEVKFHDCTVCSFTWGNEK